MDTSNVNDNKMSNESVINELYRFLRNESAESCPIKISSRTTIVGKDADLIKFTFGKDEDTCVAVAYNDGFVYTPYDWQHPEWDDPDWQITDTRWWMDCYYNYCMMIDGMPRMFI